MSSVLIVDDNAATRELLAVALRMSGYDVAVACDGREALEAVERTHPAALIVDFLMPGMTGVEVINRVRAKPGLEDVCTILATAWYGAPEDQDLDESVVVIEKPFAVRRLVDVLQRHGVETATAARGRPSEAGLR
jgi:CheY-like chemotaxis protein